MQNPTTQRLGFIGLSLLGVWMIVQAVSELAFYVPVIAAEDFDHLGWMQLLAPAVHALLGGVLVSRRVELSRALFPDDADLEIQAEASIGAFLVALLGVWLCVTSIARAAQVELSLLGQYSLTSSVSYYGDRLSYLLSAAAWSQRAPYLITLAFGIFLVLRAEGLTRAWLALRDAGRRR